MTSLVPTMMSATAGLVTRYSHSSGDSYWRQMVLSATDGASTDHDDQPLLAASEVL